MAEVAASFWEEHCTECGEPACYRTCAHYAKGRGGRCRRFAGGLRETILCEGVEVAFLPWGKMEAMFHGRMVSEDRARTLERLSDGTAWLRRLLPRIWRSVRWRLALWGATVAAPTLWQVKATAERDEHLVLEVVDRNLKPLFRGSFDLKAGEETSVECPLPRIADGALFRIFAANGEATGKIRFAYNRLTTAPVKCVAWDLDGTLWEGTLSEVGADGVKLNAEAVRLVKELDAQGIVNSIASRNDPEPALAALKQFGIEEYFVFPQIGWGPKSEGLKNLAREMNIGLDSIVFVDDREEVRNEVRTNAPGVRVVEKLKGCKVEKLKGCGVEGLGSERRKMYRDEMKRRGAARAYAGDAAAFLADSGLVEELLPVEGAAVVRCRELVQRTNQLNLTGRRYDEAAFAKLLQEAECTAVRVRDKYGDYGIVGFVAVKGAHIVECCFSCRVAEKGVERRVLERIAAGRKLSADIVATERNEKIRKIVSELLGVRG